MKHLIVLSLFLVTFKSLAQWVEPQGDTYIKLGFWGFQADQHYTGTGQKDPNATRGIFNSHVYVKHGLTSKISLSAYVPFFVRSFQFNQVSIHTGNELAPEGHENNIGDIDLGVEYQIFKQKKWVVSTALKLGLPTGEDAGGSDGSYQTGDGEFNQLIQLQIGNSFTLKNQRFYSKFGIGFNNRTQNFSDEIRWNTELGTGLLKNKLWVIGRFRSLKSLENGSLDATNNEGSIFANNIAYSIVGSSVIFKWSPQLSLSAAYALPLSGKLIYTAPTWAAGIAFRLKRN